MSWTLNQPTICDQTIGGIGHIVEVDESVVAKRKYHRGRLVKERWVVGGYETTTKLGFLEFVEPIRRAF